jgi:hypothetical protein
VPFPLFLSTKLEKIQKPELLNDILQETEELIKIFVTSIKPAEKKPRLGVVECSVLDVCFLISRLGVIGRSMFDVHLSKQLRM